MGNLFLSSFFSLGLPFSTSMLWPEVNDAVSAVSLRSSAVHRPHSILHERVTLPVQHYFHKDSRKSIQNMEKIKIILSQLVHKSEAIVTVDALKKHGIDHYFDEEISAILDSSYHNLYRSLKNTDENNIDISLQFRLLREAGYDISSDVFQRAVDEKGEFKQSLSNNIKGLMSLHEASFLNMGEDVLYKANEFSTRNLKSSMKYMEPNASELVRHTLEHPHHISLKQYKAKHYLALLSLRTKAPSSMEELAEIEFRANQQLYQHEFMKITRWWKDMGLAKELTFARDQILKWYLWSMTILPGPQFSKHRLEITKAVSFIYLIDDIFDIMGSGEELDFFTQAINSWEDSNALPSYMRICFIALQEVTCGITQFVEDEYGWNPMKFLRRSWAKLCNAFLVEAKWFANKQVPSADDYLRNGVISSGVPLLLQHISVLLGHRITDETAYQTEGDSPLVSCPAKILRLWDDLGSAKDEDQEGFDGSYVEYYMKDNPSCSIDAARAHTKNLISESWEELNKEYFFNTYFPPYLAEASMNCARMVRVMYNYDEEQKLPMMNDYIQILLSEKITT